MRRVLVLAVVVAALVAPAHASAARIFWSESNLGIVRSDETGQDLKTIDEGARNAQSFAVDNKYIYTSYYDSNTAGSVIRRTDLDGQNAEPTWISGLGSGQGLQLAAGGGHVCWIRTFAPPPNYSYNKWEVGCVDIDDAGNHSAPRIIYDTVNNTLSSIAVDEEHVYFGHGPLIHGGGPSAIARIDVDGTDYTDAVIPGAFPRGLAVNGEKIFWTEHDPQQVSPPPATVSAAPKTGGAAQVITSVPADTQGVGSVAATDTHVYWTESPPGNGTLKNIGRATVNGGDVTHTFQQRTTGIYGVAVEGSGTCKSSIDFQTSMKATGCFVQYGENKWKPIGPFRMNGIDFKSTDDSAAPVVFDTKEKSVNGDSVELSLSAPGWGSGWFAFLVPGGLHIGFPSDKTTLSWVLKDPRSVGNNLFFGALGFLQLNGSVSPTLFGFPAHAPGVELEFTTGRAALTMQVSFPTTSKAVIDPVNGLWKTISPSGVQRVSYPNAMKARVTANNDVGVDFIEGTASPADIYGIDVEQHKRRVILGEKGAPSSSTIELAKIRLGWHLASGIIDAGAVLVVHAAPSSAAQKFLSRDFFIGRTIVDGNLRFAWYKWSIGGKDYAVPFPSHMSVQANSLNRLVFPNAGLFLQRAGLQGGINLDDPNRPWVLGANLGFSIAPRFKHDFLWFQEFLSLDLTGAFELAPFAHYGTADMKAIGANILHGEFYAGEDGLFVEGDTGLDFNQILRIPFPLKIRGRTYWSWPSTGGWQMGGDVVGNVWKFDARGDLIWNGNGLGFCIKAGPLKGKGVYFDRSWHQGGCEGGPFATATSGVRSRGAGRQADEGGKEKLQAAATNRSFTVSRSNKLSSVAIRGAKAAPKVRLTGPGKLDLTIPAGDDTSPVGKVMLVSNPSDKTTYILFAGKAAPGTYKIAPESGSSAIKKVEFSGVLAAPKVSAKVKASGCRQQLTWNLKKLPGQKVTFVEVGPNGERPILTTAKASGTYSFSPLAAASVKRAVLARIEQQGTQRAEKKVATFRTPAVDPPGAVKKLKGSRKKGKVALKWGAVCGATSYLVTAPVNKVATETVVTKATASVTADKNATVTVSAIGSVGTAGKAAKVKVK